MRSQYLDILSFWSILKVISWDEVFPGVIFTDREMSVLKKRDISAWRFHLQKNVNLGLKTATWVLQAFFYNPMYVNANILVS